MGQKEQERSLLEVSPEAMAYRVHKGEQHKRREEELPYVVEAADKALEEIGPFTDIILEQNAHSAQDGAESGEEEDESR